MQGSKRGWRKGLVRRRKVREGAEGGWGYRGRRDVRRIVDPSAEVVVEG
jgi:hypothetical protein